MILSQNKIRGVAMSKINTATLFAIILAVPLLIASDSYAGCKLICDVQYGVGQNYGVTYRWSKSYRHEVEYYTGDELILITGKPKFTPKMLYALIWFAQDQVAIIKVNLGRAVVHLKDASEKSVLFFLNPTNGMGALIGTDQQGKDWRITYRGY